MLAVLFVVFVVVPVVELAVLIQIGHVIGTWNAIGLLLLVSLAGAWLVKREGLGVLRRFRQQMDAGRVPGRELADGVLILFAGALLLTPGFVTDFFGLLLLVPPVRSAVRAGAMHRVVVHNQRRLR
ncbi:MAG TPA: FxsA family protein [Acidimicrobiales bacterium]|nr:FxsA family protein [Acidimicrobiales bacterium]